MQPVIQAVQTEYDLYKTYVKNLILKEQTTLTWKSTFNAYITKKAHWKSFTPNFEAIQAVQKEYA